LGRQKWLLARRLCGLALLVCLRLGVTQGSARARLEEHVGAGDKTDAVAVLAAQARREREAVDDLLIALIDRAELRAHQFALFLLRRQLLVLLVYEFAAAAHLLIERVAEIEDAAGED